MTDKEIPTLYQWAGGIDQIQGLFKAFYDRVPNDPILVALDRATPSNRG
jgi:truncated hemoglobin YjbI